MKAIKVQPVWVYAISRFGKGIVADRSLQVPAPLKPWGNVLVVEYPYKAFEIIITIKVDGKKPIKKTRGTYIKEWAAENRGKELKREAYKRGFHEIEAQNCLWAVQKDSSYVVECSLNELIIKKASQYNDDNDRKYKEVDFDEEVVEYDVDDLTG